MKIIASTVIAAVTTLSLLAPAQEKSGAEPEFAKVPAKPSPQAIAARNNGIRVAWEQAINAAHQLAASQGYRRRDAHWGDALRSEGFTIVPLQLFAGNDYYLVLGTDSGVKNVSVSAFDPGRRLIKSAPDRGENELVLRIRPEKSGKHYLRLHQTKPSEKPIHCALTYIYR